MLRSRNTANNKSLIKKHNLVKDNIFDTNQKDYTREDNHESDNIFDNKIINQNHTNKPELDKLNNKSTKESSNLNSIPDKLSSSFLKNGESFNKINLTENKTFKNDDNDLTNASTSKDIEEITIETARDNSQLNDKNDHQHIINNNINTDRLLQSDKHTDRLLQSDRLTDRHNSDRNKINSLENIDEDYHSLSERLKPKHNQKENDQESKDKDKIINVDINKNHNTANQQINEMCNNQNVLEQV